MKKILFICFALIFVLILVSCDISGDVSNTSNSSDSLEAQTPLPDTTTTGKNEEPSSPIPPENIGNTTSNNDVVLDPTKPSRETAMQIKAEMTTVEVFALIGKEFWTEKAVASGQGMAYTCKLSDGGVLEVYFKWRMTSDTVGTRIVELVVIDDELIDAIEYEKAEANTK